MGRTRLWVGLGCGLRSRDAWQYDPNNPSGAALAGALSDSLRTHLGSSSEQVAMPYWMESALCSQGTTMSATVMSESSVIVTQCSVVGAPVGLVWARVVTVEGINDEMLPWMTMSPPRGTTLSIDTVEVGVPLGRFWLRLFGVLPFDFDNLTIAELEPGRRFHEKSTMLSMRRWEHERIVEPAGDEATAVLDRVTFEARLPFLTPVFAGFVGWFFAHRHRRLGRHFDEQR